MAIIVKEFVYTWYGKITQDRSFIQEVLGIIAHCTTQLEQRARRVDWFEVLGDEIPDLVLKHVKSESILESPHFI